MAVSEFVPAGNNKYPDARVENNVVPDQSV